MLGSVRESGGGEWSVLIMDDITTRVMSSSCRISDVLDYGVSCTPIFSVWILPVTVARSVLQPFLYMHI